MEKHDGDKPKKHLFICTHKRDGKDSCGGRGSEDLVDDLKKWVKNEGLKGEVKVTRSGCLGLCEDGIVAVCYPQGEWLTEIRKGDADELKKKLK